MMQSNWYVLATRSDSQANHLHWTSGCAQLLRSLSQWTGRGKTQQQAEAAAVYQQATLGNVSQLDSVLVLLHHSRIDEILNWTKEHLGAYLASTDVIIEKRDDPG
jgi:hypothetical protein